MSAPSPDRRPWRWLFVAYALLMTVATHWPHLQVESDDVPAPDKLAHMLIFATLAVLLWRTGWVRHAGAWVAILLAWTVVDEATQGFAWVGRHLSWDDLVAGQLGIVVVAAWRWALAPLGEASSRARQRFFAASAERVFARPSRWIAIGAAGFVGAVGGAAITYAFVGLDPLAMLFMFIAGGFVGVHLPIEAFRRGQAEAMRRDRQCTGCGASCVDLEFGSGTTAACPSCGRPQWAGQWQGRLDLPRRTLIRIMIAPLVVGVLLFGSMFVLYLLTVLAHMSSPGIGSLTRFYHGLPDDFRMSLDLTFVLAIGAVVSRIYRRRLARIFDAQDRRCMYCEHDLRGAPSAAGSGRCSECGRQYHQPPTA